MIERALERLMRAGVEAITVLVAYDVEGMESLSSRFANVKLLVVTISVRAWPTFFIYAPCGMEPFAYSLLPLIKKGHLLKRRLPGVCHCARTFS